MGVPSRTCVQCGQLLEPDARFCNICGQEIPARYEPTQLNQPARYEPTQMNQPARYEPTQLNQPARYEPTQLNQPAQHPPPPAGYQPTQLNQPAPSDYHPPSPSEFQPMPGELPPVADYPSGQMDFSSWFQDRPSRPAGPGAPPRAYADEAYPAAAYPAAGYPGYPGPPGGPPPGPARPPRRRVLPLLATVVVVAVLAAAVAFVLLRHSISGSASATQGASTPASSASASSSSSGEQQAATRLAGLLSQSGHDRSAIAAAYSDVNDCGPQLSQDAQTFAGAATSRQQLLSQLSAMPGRSALPSGMLQTLTTAWQASITADQDYGQWAQGEASGTCKKNDHADAHFRAATGPDAQATSEKQNFVGQWNPIAAQYHLPTYQWDQI